jgi:hypothetical protein
MDQEHIRFGLGGPIQQGGYMIYYAITSNQVWDLGVQLSPGNADHYAVNQFNIHQARDGYLIVNRAELKEIVRSGLKRLEAEEA